MKSVVRGAAAGAAVLLLSSLAFAFARAQDAAKPADGGEKKAAVVPFFGNETCWVTGKPVNKNKFVESDGQRAYVCCNNCLGKARADVKAALAAAYKETKPAGNKKCPVSGHAIEAAKAAAVTFESRKIALCCSDCESEFKKTPRLFATMAVYGAEDVKNATCPVMKVNDGSDDETLEDVLVVYDGKIVRLCCEDCVPEFVKAPETFMPTALGKK